MDAYPDFVPAKRRLFITGLDISNAACNFYIKDPAGYAVFGAVYFLIAGVLLSRKLAQLAPARQTLESLLN